MGVILLFCFISIIGLIVYLFKKNIFKTNNQGWLTIMFIFGHLTPFFFIFILSELGVPYYRYGLGKTYLSLIDVGNAGYAIIPLFAIGVIRMFYSITQGKLQTVDIVIQATFSLMAFWIGFRFLFRFSFLVFIPFLYAVLHTFIAYHIAVVVNEKKTTQKDFLATVAWFLGLSATYIVKLTEAKKLFNELPPVQPMGCFIVTAAGKGHKDFVGSFFSPAYNKVITRQLIIFYQFEYYLMGNFPRFHKGLRKVYNRVGPHIAKRIRTRWIADLVYLVLKPLEYLILLILMLRK